MQVSQSRLNVCDNYKSQVSEPAKTVRLYKEQQLKKVPGLRWSVSLSLACLQDFPSVNQSDSHFHLRILRSPSLPPSLPLPFSPQTIDQLSGIQAELQESVKELVKAKKKYYDCEQVAHAVREKADIEAK